MADGRDHSDLAEALEFIPVESLDYQEWAGVGMALKDAGLDVSVWDAWSATDSRPGKYQPGSCEKKWQTFDAASYPGRPVTSGSIVAMAKANGWRPGSSRANDAVYGWDDVIDLTAENRPDAAWAGEEDPTIPAPGNDAESNKARLQMLADYLEALFERSDHVSYVVSARTNDDGRIVPDGVGSYAQTAGEIIDNIHRRLSSGDASKYDLGAVIGDQVVDDAQGTQAGGWVRFNPLDGKGVKNSDVTEYRYALVESDELEYAKQLPMIRDMHLPCAAVVTSGNKSVHAIVHIDAGTDYALYRKRVEELYTYCKQCGFNPDTQNKNPSRLSRMPGLVRGDQLQALVGVNEGCASWDDWCSWRAENEDDLPEDAGDDWDEPICLAPALIGTEEHGLLRQGQKMVLAGPSKAGKSFALIDLAEAIACGASWWGYPCVEGKVYYINLEIADQSFRNRQRIVWESRAALEETGSGLGSLKRNFIRLDLRGHAADMEALAPKIIHRVLKRGPKGTFKAIIIDPVYKVNGGDENDAASISRFTNQLDRVASECGCAVIYAHHHAKGSMADRRSIDRMSGSGVFARDADAIVDMCELEVTEDDPLFDELNGRTCWRVDATLREFKSPEPFDLIFDFPRFLPDASGRLKRLDLDGGGFDKINARRKSKSRDTHADVNAAIGRAVAACKEQGKAPTRARVRELMNADQEWRANHKNATEQQLIAWTQPSKSGSWGQWTCVPSEDGVGFVVTARAALAGDEGTPGAT